MFKTKSKAMGEIMYFLLKAMNVQINHSSNNFLTIVGTMTLFLKISLSFDGCVMYASYIVLLSSSLSTCLEEMRKFVKIHHLN